MHTYTVMHTQARTHDLHQSTNMCAKYLRIAYTEAHTFVTFTRRFMRSNHRQMHFYHQVYINYLNFFDFIIACVYAAAAAEAIHIARIRVFMHTHARTQSRTQSRTHARIHH